MSNRTGFPMRHLLTTDEGIEDIVIDEILELHPEADAGLDPSGFPGLVLVGGATCETLLGLTTIHHVIEIRGETTGPTFASLPTPA